MKQHSINKHDLGKDPLRTLPLIYVNWRLFSANFDGLAQEALYFIRKL